MYFDEAADRRDGRHQERVEEGRLSVVFASNLDAYRKWRNSVRTASRGLTGAALEAAVLSVAQIFPDNVIRVGA